MQPPLDVCYENLSPSHFHSTGYKNPLINSEAAPYTLLEAIRIFNRVDIGGYFVSRNLPAVECMHWSATKGIQITDDVYPL
jgi:hypothetical protein